MILYRSVRDGRVVERHKTDEWLEASAGWERDEDEGEGFDPEIDDPETPTYGLDAADDKTAEGDEQ